MRGLYDATCYLIVTYDYYPGIANRSLWSDVPRVYVILAAPLQATRNGLQ